MNWRYKNLTVFAVILILLFLTKGTPAVQGGIQAITGWGYIGMFAAGIFFICSFTVVPAALVLCHFALTSNLYTLAAWAGAVVGDYLIFRFFRDGVFEELKPLFMRCGGARLSRFLQRPACAWMVPILGAIIIASPFPDEIGIALMGVSRVNSWQFILLSYALNATGIYVIIANARSLAFG